MRILHFNQHGTHTGGVEGYIADVARELRTVGHESGLVYFEPGEPGDLMEDGSSFQHAVSPKGWVITLAKLLADFRPDVAYVHAIYDPTMVRWLADRVPTVAYVHGPYLVCPGSAQYLRRSRMVCSRRSGIGCLVKAQTEQCCFGRNPARHLGRLQSVMSFIEIYSHLPILVGSVFMRDLLIRNGIPGEKISLLAPVLFPLTVPVPQVTDSSHQILFSGRLVPEKGLGLLIDALVSIDGPWTLNIAGDGPERAQLETLVHNYKLHDRVNFLGWCSATEMERLYAQSAFVVLPSLWPEPFGRVGPEAAKHGRPTIAFDVGGVRDWLEDGVTGYIVPANDVSTLAFCIQKLLDDPQHLDQLGQQSHALAMHRWNKSDHVQQLIAHLENAITPFGRGATSTE